MMDTKFMKMAIKQAILGAEKYDEVPIGAVIVKDGKVISRAHNLKEKKNCANYHAEMVAIERATKKLNSWRLIGCDMYVTLEPCPMCVGALINARIDNIYFGAYDEKAGALKSKCSLMEMKFNHKANYEGGILEQECAQLISDYFKKKRCK